MAFPLMAGYRRPESKGRAEKPRAQVPKLQNEYPDKKQNLSLTKSSINLDRIALTPNKTRDSELNAKVAIHMSEKSFEYMKVRLMSLGMKCYREFQKASRSLILFD